MQIKMFIKKNKKCKSNEGEKERKLVLIKKKTFLWASLPEKLSPGGKRT